MEKFEGESARAAMKESVALLEVMEHLLIGSDGRPHLAAMRFGGVTRLAKRLTAFLNHGSIHRDENGDECCARFLRDVCQNECDFLHCEGVENVDGHKKLNKNLIHAEIFTKEDIQQWVTNRIVEATLYPALTLITTKKDKTDSLILVSRNYESHSYMRQPEAVRRLVAGARPFDDQDSSGLAEIALFGSEVRKDPEKMAASFESELIEHPDMPRAILSKIGLSFISTNLTSAQLGTSEASDFSIQNNNKVIPRTTESVGVPLTHVSIHQIYDIDEVSTEAKTNLSADYKNVTNSIKFEKPFKMDEDATRFIRSRRNNLVEDPLASSCPGLTPVAFQRYVGQRNWNSESLHDEDELEKVCTRRKSKSLQSVYKLPEEITQSLNVHSIDASTNIKTEQTLATIELLSNTSVSSEQAGEVTLNEEWTNDSCNDSSLGSISAISSRGYLPAHLSTTTESMRAEINTTSASSSRLIKGNKIEDKLGCLRYNQREQHVMMNPGLEKIPTRLEIKRGHRRTQSDTQLLAAPIKSIDSGIHFDEQRLLRLFPIPRRKANQFEEHSALKKGTFQMDRENETIDMGKSALSTGKLNYDTIGPFASYQEYASNHQVDYNATHDSSLINYILSGAFSRDVSRGVRYGHIGQGSYALIAENAHLILAEALIRSGSTLTYGYCKGCIDRQRVNPLNECKENVPESSYQKEKKQNSYADVARIQDEHLHCSASGGMGSNTVEFMSGELGQEKCDNSIQDDAMMDRSTTVNMIPDPSVNKEESKNKTQNWNQSPSQHYITKRSNLDTENKIGSSVNGTKIVYGTSPSKSVPDSSRHKHKIYSEGKHVGMSSSAPIFYSSLSNDNPPVSESMHKTSIISNTKGNDQQAVENCELEDEELVHSIQRKHISASGDTLKQNTFQQHSAEATALDLLFTLKDPHILKASDLTQLLSTSNKCLVSEKDAPQKLLPIPSNLIFTNDESYKTDNQIVNTPQVNKSLFQEKVDQSDENVPEPLYDWSPPRPQLILEIYQKPHRKRDAMRKQNYMCHDCGIRPSSPSLAVKGAFRFCYYFGKYSCTTCHSNQTHVLPSAIIYRWDFKEYPVSNFAHTVLTRLSMDPLFTVEELNPRLVKKVPKLKIAFELRNQAAGIAKYLVSCRIAGRSLREEEYKDCINIQDPRTLSLVELCLIKLDAYGKSLRSQINLGIEHIFGGSSYSEQKDRNPGCPLCSARGFICEACRSEDIIYPFQSEVQQCKECFACYHNKCYVKLKHPKDVDNVSCLKCERVHRRMQEAELTEQFKEDIKQS